MAQPPAGRPSGRPGSPGRAPVSAASGDRGSRGAPGGLNPCRMPREPAARAPNRGFAGGPGLAYNARPPEPTVPRRRRDPVF
ncbi:MAG: hypothetical protein E6K81_04200 [Candidatus Eisenbacteria bacterium]|uniref:Uncharacterized protein n=1 Tax=Eiseniibacteriota bacterium TaxID=2212470 RepID=A0A538UCC8_UNCEI|nr:MAG: hypothetical protein E6K81_04200 [Candidatus Eisenbacteria bacterium]